MATLTDSKLEDTLEGIVDANELSRVLYALASMCAAKAEHIASSYNDLALSDNWANIGEDIGIVADKAEETLP